MSFVNFESCVDPSADQELERNSSVASNAQLFLFSPNSDFCFLFPFALWTTSSS